MKRGTALGAIVALSACGVATANDVEVGSGQTSVLLDTATLEAAASLALSGVSEDVIVEGTIPGSVAFAIAGRDHESLPTTFGYWPQDFLGSFSGTIEHEGSVFFNEGAVEVGNFTIGFDAGRAGSLGGLASGFFVESTTGISAILFDVAAPSALVPAALGLEIEADLLVSPEFGAFLFDNGLSASNLQGADVGDALVEGGTGCSAIDFDDDGNFDYTDVIAFLSAVTGDEARADLDGTGVFDMMDVIGFLSRWTECE